MDGSPWSASADLGYSPHGWGVVEVTQIAEGMKYLKAVFNCMDQRYRLGLLKRAAMRQGLGIPSSCQCGSICDCGARDRAMHEQGNLK